MSKIFGGTKDFSPSVRKWLYAHNEDYITKIEVQRQPVSSMITKALDWITAGTFSSEAAKLGYDTFFHLGLVVTTNTGVWQIEKLAQISVAPWKNTGLEMINAPFSNTLTVGMFFSRARAKMGDADFFEYDAFRNNCQKFALRCLSANFTVAPNVRTFITQPVDVLIDKLPGYTERVARTLTDVGSIAERVVFGAALQKGVAKSVILKLSE